MNRISQEIAACRLEGVKSDAAGAFEGRYLFPESFAGFDGHFPGFPILPAIVEILTVVSLVGEACNCRQRLVAVLDAKFMKPVRPGQELSVRCRTRSIQGTEHYDAQLSVGATCVASMLLELEPEGEAP